MGAKRDDDQYPQDEADRRRDAVLKHMLSRSAAAAQAIREEGAAAEQGAR